MYVVVPTTESLSLSNAEAHRSDKGRKKKSRKAGEMWILIVNLDRLLGFAGNVVVIERHSECISTAEQEDQAGVLIAHQR